jgi:hypothetical protein
MSSNMLKLNQDKTELVLEKGVLWREGDEGKSARRVVPKMYREQIVKLCHDPPLAGHQGIERTLFGLP